MWCFVRRVSLGCWWVTVPGIHVCMQGGRVCSDVMARGHWYVKHKLNYSLPCSLIVGSTDSRNENSFWIQRLKSRLKHVVCKVSKLDLEAFWCWRMLFELHVKEDVAFFCTVNCFILKHETFMTKYLWKYVYCGNLKSIFTRRRGSGFHISFRRTG